MFVVLGVLILNTGTPDAPTPEAIRPYLKQFLSDRNLINVPRIIWKPVLNFCILPNRPKKTAAHYQQFWTEEGSPFLLTSLAQRDKLRARLAELMGEPVAVELGMRYGNPSTKSAIEALLDAGVSRIVVVPLYPQETKACENSVELMPFSQYKDDMCPACREETGFNPAFYNADSISAQQRAYNLTPHFVYMAYFSPQHLKVGISSETRGIERLLEQGARVAGILKRFANADEARALEAHLCAQEGIYETMRLGTKVRLLSDPFKADAAIETVYEAARAHGVEPEGGVLDLTKYYFGDVEAVPDIVQLPDDSPSDMVAGRCVGMVGGILMLEQGGNVFAAPVKEWESYEVEITVGELLCEYEYEPQQMGLF